MNIPEKVKILYKEYTVEEQENFMMAAKSFMARFIICQKRLC